MKPHILLNSIVLLIAMSYPVLASTHKHHSRSSPTITRSQMHAYATAISSILATMTSALNDIGDLKNVASPGTDEWNSKLQDYCITLMELPDDLNVINPPHAFVRTNRELMKALTDYKYMAAVLPDASKGSQRSLKAMLFWKDRGDLDIQISQDDFKAMAVRLGYGAGL